MSTFSSAASIIIREFTLRKVDVEIIFNVLNRDVLVNVLRVLIVSSSATQLVFLLALKTKKISVASAAIIPLIELLVLVLRYRIRLLLTDVKYVCLRLKIFNAKIRSQNVLGQLLLELLFDFLPKFLMDNCVIGVQFGEYDHFKASNDPLFLKFEFLRNLHNFFIFHM